MPMPFLLLTGGAVSVGNIVVTPPAATATAAVALPTITTGAASVTIAAVAATATAAAMAPDEVGLPGTVLATLDIRIDFDNNGIFNATDEDVTSDVLLDAGYGEIRIARGREQLRSLSPPAAGAADFMINNSADLYGPSSNLKRGRMASVRAAYGGTTYDLFRGLLDYPTREPGLLFKRVAVPCIGTFSRLIGNQKLSTELFSNITTAAAMREVLNAAGWPKNLPDYITLDLATNLAGYWRLGETSGDALDASTYGNDGTVTIGGGSRGAVGLSDHGDLSLDFNEANTAVSIADDASIQNIFDTGGFVHVMFNLDSFPAHDQRLVHKTGWFLYLTSTAQLNFYAAFSGTPGRWQVATPLTAGKTYQVVVNYDANAANDPTFYIHNLTDRTVTTASVGSGATEVNTPTGTRTTDVGSPLLFGEATLSPDGRLDEIALWDRNPTAAEIYGMFARALERPAAFDVGLTTLDWWWLDEESAWDAMRALLATEGPGAVLYEDGAGRMVFKNRHARMTETRSITTQATFGGGGIFMEAPLAYEDGIRNVVNECEIEVKTREAQSLSVVWSLGSTVTLSPGEVRKYIARAGNPFTGALTPVEATDYTVAGGSVTASLDRTSGASCTITLTAGASGASVTGLQLRAQLVTVTNTTRVANTLDMATSIAEHGKRPFALDVRAEIDVDTAQDFCNAVVGAYGDGRPSLRLTFAAGSSTAAMTAALARDVSDRITVTEPSVPINSESYLIEHISHDIAYGGALLRATLGCEKIVDDDFWVLGTSLLESGTRVGY